MARSKPAGRLPATSAARAIRLRLAARNSQRPPLGSRPVLGQLHDLTDVIGEMADVAVQGSGDTVRLAPDVDRPLQVFRSQRLYGRIEQVPPSRPPVHQLGSGIASMKQELVVPVPVRLLA